MVIAVILAAVIFALAHLYGVSVAESTHERINTYIDTELQYEAANYDKYLEELNELLLLPRISDADKGHVYERMAQLYKFKGDTLSFYHTMGNALYYLERGGNRSVAVNIYEDIANYYIADNNFDQAKKILESAYEICPIEDIEDPQVRSYAYRMQAIILRHDGDHEKARQQIELSTKIVSENQDALWYGSYLAINDAVLAGIAYDEGSTEEAAQILDKNKDSEYFTAPIYADIITRDFSLVYYETACRLAAADGDVALLREYLDKCRNASEQYGFYKKELNIINGLLEGGYDLSPDLEAGLNERVLQIYEKITQIQSDEYAEMINSPLQSGISEQEQLNRQHAESVRRLRIYAVIAVIIIAVFLVLSLLIIHALTDPLTRIGNRRAMDQYLNLLSFFSQKIFAVMMDIDDFKAVNDTYGHDQGDEVLIRIGALLKNMKTRNIRCFRFGGEEFVMFVKNLDQGAVLRLVENVRNDISWQTWDFPGRVTASIGVSGGKAGTALLSLADENMYHSKSHGKNVVTYDEAGEKIIFREMQ